MATFRRHSLAQRGSLFDSCNEGSEDRIAELQYQTADKRKSLRRNYDRAAWYYETSARLYSRNRIYASKRYQLNHINRNDKTLYLGVGSGEDALMAAEHGADVTCVDISSGMLAVLKRRLDSAKLTAELICGSALEIDRFGEFDVCCANYFLNVFQESDMVKMMRHAVRLIRPGGKLLIADVALSQGNAMQRVMNRFYRKFAMVGFWALGLVPLHKDYEYCGYFSDLNLDVDECKYFDLFAGGPIVFQSIVGRKMA